MSREDVYSACITAYAQSIKATLDLMLRDEKYVHGTLSKEEIDFITNAQEFFKDIETKRLYKLGRKGFL